MNENALKEAVAAELELGDKALKGAYALFKDDLYADAISRAYYAVLHCAKAALATVNVEASSHDGAIAMFGLHFVKKGLIDRRFSKIFGRSRAAREKSDYDAQAAVKFTKEDAEKRVAEAKEFTEGIRKLLKEKGF
ncbi:HEPN domain-containing protein [candidate division NPL-UPA2 bacterium]|nr:HEPN domain-containing protein [candidate division NPL-UPA2 bacterium]